MKECCDMKGFLTFIVLKLISKRNMSGEDIRQELKKRRGSKPSPGTIYPVLKSLGKSGFIEEIKSSGKEKKYRLTKKGHKELTSATKKFCQIFYDMKDEFQKGC
ncbi:MAG: PadR family transcriptional regulator [Nanoarchaeota archaeon]|nr:PadR family transcriptional regulator [Nanoarchaeota archaeon]